MKLDYFGYRNASEEAKRRPVALVVGKADFLRALVIEDLLRLVLAGADRAMDLVERDASAGAGAEIIDLLDDLRTPSLLGGPRVVFLRGLQALDKEDRKRLEEHLSLPSAPGFLILEGTALAANTRLFRAIEKRGIVIQCRPLYETPPPWARGGADQESEVARWIRLRAEDRGVRIAPAAVRAATEAWGGDLAAIDGALEQAALLAGDAREIGEDVMRSLAPDSRPDPVYRVVDQILAADLPAAVKGLRSIFLHGLQDAAGRGRANPGGVAQILIRGLQGRLSSIWSAQIRRSRGEEEKEILQGVGVPPFLARRFWDQVAANPSSTIPAKIGALLDAERSIKTGAEEPMAAAEALLVRLGNPS